MPAAAPHHPPTFAGNDIQRIAKRIDAGVLPPRADSPREGTPAALQGTELASPVAPPPFAGTELASPVTPPPAEPAPTSAPFSAPAGPDPYLGKTLDGRYQIEKVLGEGGMGVVYAARHTIIGKRIAIKILRDEYTRDQEILDRFVLEAKAASSIGNPHIVDISDFGRLPDGATYFVMEMLEGESLADAMTIRVAGAVQPRPIELDRLCAITLQICDGLGAAHERGIVHRDLKPDNIFLVKQKTGDFVKILDFGIAKVSGSPTQKLTRAGAVFGTPQYMSPEQAAGAAVDSRADVYALGVILYEMVSGQLPFDGDNFMGILTMHMYKAPVPVRALVNTASCPPGLEAVIQKCLQKRPEHRYQTMAELADDLRRLAQKAEPRAVADLMARPSAGGVPQDYFKSAPHAIVPAAPASAAQKPWPVWVWLAGVVGAVAIVAGVLLIRKVGAASPSAASAPSAAPTTGPTSEASSGSPEVAAPAQPAKVDATAQASADATARSVTLELTPRDATVTRDGKPLTGGTLSLAPGEKVSLEVSAKGFETRTVTVDGSQPKVVVALEPKKVGASPSPAKGKNGTSGVVDTW
jgi:serine/threonine-protein kinase